MEESFAMVRARQIRSLGDIPLTVVSAGQLAISAGRGISAEDVEQTKVTLDALQAELAALSTRGKRVVVQESGHYIQVDQPEAVIGAIHEVVEAARQA
jgi:pimeloyl-ACP methyl ester carboxylesterase